MVVVLWYEGRQKVRLVRSGVFLVLIEDYKVFS
jgi:hypothetical protein